MREWNIIHKNFRTKYSVLTAPDEHMPYIIQLHIMSIRWTYYEQMKQQNIWSVHLTSRKKKEEGAEEREKKSVNKRYVKDGRTFPPNRSPTLTSMAKNKTTQNEYKNWLRTGGAQQQQQQQQQGTEW